MNQSNYITSFSSKAFFGFLLAVCMLISTTSSAQGWEKRFGAEDFDEFSDIIQTRDLGFVTTGYLDDNKIAVFRLDPEGNVIWRRDDLIPSPGGQGRAVIETADGSLVVAGFCNACQAGNRDLYVAKLSAFGETIWSRGYGGANNDEAWDVIEAPDGSLAVTGYSEDGGNANVYFLRLDAANGNAIVEETYDGSNGEDDRAYGLTLSSLDNDFILAGSTDVGANDTYTYLLKVSAAGDTIWTREYTNSMESTAFDIVESINILSGQPEGYALTGSVNNNDILFLKTDLAGAEITSATYGDAGTDLGNAIIQTEDGGYLIAGRDGLNGQVALPTLIKVDTDGFSTWSNTYGNDSNQNLIAGAAQGLTANAEGGFTFVGARAEGTNLIFDAIIFKIGGTGDHFTNIIEGRVFFDFDDDCTLDLNEFGFENWNIIAEGPRTFYQTSDQDGFFSIPVDAGNYEVSLVPPSDYWSSCTNSLTVSLNSPYDSTTLNFPVQVEQLCAYLEIDASTPFLTPCTNSEYYISYRNEGTISAQGAYIIADLDPSLVLLGATQSYTFLGGNSYRFDLGNVSVTEADSFRVTVLVDCNVEVGQALCFDAHIYPDSLCVPLGNWDGSSVSVEADCNGDQVDLRIRNTGANDMTEPQGYVIIEDELMLRPAGPIILGKGEDSLIVRPADGTTYRIIMDQSAGHPGKSMPTVAIEGCVDGGGAFSTGFLTMFPEDDADNFLVKDCQENIPSTEIPSNTKRGYPKGFGDDRLITPETELKYVLNFENNGLDTAIRMVIRDTLSPFLDPTSVRPGVSSHDYTYEVTGEGILKFTFEDINLQPGGSASSRGFVKYTISQKPDNPGGALIKNGAAIFFNFGHPNYTENTCHKIEDFVRVSTDEIFDPAVQQVKVFPNPFTDQATVEIIGEQSFKNIRFSVYDTSGKQVDLQTGDASIFTIRRNNLPAGFYFYQLEANARLISTGKMVIQ